MRIRIVLLIAAVVLAQPLRAAKLALLVGIDDYTASRLQADKKSKPVPGRDWPNLDGAVNDIRLAADLLVAVHGFRRTDIVTLTDQQATRGAILTAIRKLGASARRGDVVVFYYSGHGSQVRNTASRELDKMDESLVPADSRLGA
ncbi:MAG: caspase family protein, partial [Acidobacteria bacterium]|nr:caspase family protein [Acidobacteriota bacterium]